jgi:hypothetical protein
MGVRKFTLFYTKRTTAECYVPKQPGPDIEKDWYLLDMFFRIPELGATSVDENLPFLKADQKPF